MYSINFSIYPSLRSLWPKVSELFAEIFHAPLQSFVWRHHNYWCTVLVHQYRHWKSTKTSGVHFFYKSSFFSLENQHTCAYTYLLILKMVILLKIRRRDFFQRDSIGCHALGKLRSSDCCNFEMNHATGMETCTKIYFLFMFNLVFANKNS